MQSTFDAFFNQHSTIGHALKILKILQLTCTICLSFLLVACQLPQREPAATRFEPDLMLREVHRLANNLSSTKTAFEIESTTESRFFTLQDIKKGEYLYSYDANHTLIAARGKYETKAGNEELIWLSTNGFVRRNDGQWEKTHQYPDQSLSLFNAYQVFAKLQNRMKMLDVNNHRDFVEFYYDSDLKAGLQTLSELGNINLQQLPLHGLRAIAHFYIHKQLNLLQQVNLNIVDQSNNKTLLKLQLLFYDVNQPVQIKAPEDVHTGDQAEDTDEMLNENERWTLLNDLLRKQKSNLVYNVLSDLKYTYNVQNQRLQGHTVNQGQVVRTQGQYIYAGDRRIQNDRVDSSFEFAEGSKGSFLKDEQGWREDKFYQAPEKDFLPVLLYDLMSLNQGMNAFVKDDQVIFSYSGTNQLVFVICSHLFDLDLSELKGQTIQIDFDLHLNRAREEISQLQIRLRSPYNDAINLHAKMQFVHYGDRAVVTWPLENNGQITLP